MLKPSLILAMPFLASLVCLPACGAAPSGQVTFQVTPSKQDAKITVDANQERAIIQIVSPSGIGGAELSIVGPVPKEILMQLHLRGLEELDFSYGPTTVTVAISSSPGNAVHESVLVPGSQDTEISQPSPYWMEVRIVPEGNAPATIPLQEGYIEVRAPADLLSSGARTFALRWVDFFRY
jgi:hypothetical protein